MTPHTHVVRVAELWCLLLVSMFCRSTQDGSDKQTGGFLCGAQNVTLNASNQKILLTWEDGPLCAAVGGVLVYELVVLVENQQLHHDEVAVPPDQLGSTHRWSWRSPLALECAAHSLRIRSRLRDQGGPFQEELTPPGVEASGEPAVYPQQDVFEVGSRATFCCVLPAGETFHSMYLSGYQTVGNITVFSDRLVALTIDLKQDSGSSFTDVICWTNTSENGAAVYIGYPPDDRDLLCETRDLESVECVWTVGRDTHISLKSPTLYELLGSPCLEGQKGKCSKKIQVNAGEQSWTLTAQNQLGRKQLTDRADPLRRVRVFSPVGLTVSARNATDIRLTWRWEGRRYQNLSITCQLQVEHGGSNASVGRAQQENLHSAAAPLQSETSGVGLNVMFLKNLIPDWRYTARLRCGAAPHFWKWSEWSSSVEFRTLADVPDALDVWMQRTDSGVTIMWKELPANQSHGRILDYEVTWTHTETSQRLNRSVVRRRLALTLERREELSVSVTARNANGSSAPSTITIPRFNPEVACVNSSRISGGDGGFLLSWSASPAASCGYVLDWCPASGACRLDWVKVPPRVTRAQLSSGIFQEGRRYLLSVYACTPGPPLLLQTQEGYIRETRIPDGLFRTLRWEQQGSDVEVLWERVAFREQSAFILGYSLHCRDHHGRLVANASTEHPEATSLTLRNLPISSYTLTLTARTALGECGASYVSATLNSLTDNLVQTVFISLLVVFGLLSLAVILCYRHWTCIRRKVYPPIPQPVLRDHWLTSLREPSCYPIRMDVCHHSEFNSPVVPELLGKAGEAGRGVCVSRENNTHSHTHTHTAYCNILWPDGTEAASTGVYPNPSYDLMVQTEGQQADLGPDGGSGSSGYHPQTPPEPAAEAPASPMSVVSTYMLLPCLPPEK